MHVLLAEAQNATYVGPAWIRELTKMRYPGQLVPTTAERVALSDGAALEVPKATPTFLTWTGSPPGSTYGGKTILAYRNEPVFAELLILRAFSEEGCEGAWIDTFGNRKLRAFWPEPETVELPAAREQLLTSLTEDRHAKPWDVFCWRGDDVAFVEAKRAEKDHIRASQLAFLEKALAAGISLSSFLIVEWRVADSVV